MLRLKPQNSMSLPTTSLTAASLGSRVRFSFDTEPKATGTTRAASADTCGEPTRDVREDLAGAAFRPDLQPSERARGLLAGHLPHAFARARGPHASREDVRGVC